MINDTGQANLNVNVKRILSLVMAAYVVLVIAFAFLADDQLYYRQSRGNIAMAAADAGVAELSKGVIVEQDFYVNIERLKSVSVQWGTFYRTNAGTVTMELVDLRDGSVLISGSYDAAAITDGQLLTMSFENTIETAFGTPLKLRLYSDSSPGQAVTPLKATGIQQAGYALSVNGETVGGTLIFSASGDDYIWTGLHYWEFAAALGIVLIILFLIIWRKNEKGKRSYIIHALLAMQKYNFLIRQLVSRNFKTRYKRSVLGVVWSFLNPLLMMSVQYIVFSNIFRMDIDNYPAYLLIGVVSFGFFSESCGQSLMSILGNAGLITKVYMPKYIYPVTQVISSVVNFAISLIPLIMVSLFTGVHFQKAAVLALFFWVCLIVFCMGMGMLLSASMVFFRDTQFLWGVLSTMWMYATPIFYPETILPENLRGILNVNPLYHFLKNTRICILDGISPEPRAYIQCAFLAVAMLAFGSFVFYKTQDKFVLHI